MFNFLIYVNANFPIFQTNFKYFIQQCTSFFVLLLEMNEERKTDWHKLEKLNGNLF